MKALEANAKANKAEKTRAKVVAEVESLPVLEGNEIRIFFEKKKRKEAKDKLANAEKRVEW